MNLAAYIYGDTESPASNSLPQFIKTASSSVKAMQIWNVMRQIAGGVAFLHDHNEVHRDLKPHNSIHS